MRRPCCPDHVQRGRQHGDECGGNRARKGRISSPEFVSSGPYLRAALFFSPACSTIPPRTPGRVPTGRLFLPGGGPFPFPTLPINSTTQGFSHQSWAVLLKAFPIWINRQELWGRVDLEGRSIPDRLLRRNNSKGFIPTSGNNPNSRHTRGSFAPE